MKSPNALKVKAESPSHGEPQHGFDDMGIGAKIKAEEAIFGGVLGSCQMRRSENENRTPSEAETENLPTNVSIFWDGILCHANKERGCSGHDVGECWGGDAFVVMRGTRPEAAMRLVRLQQGLRAA